MIFGRLTIKMSRMVYQDQKLSQGLVTEGLRHKRNGDIFLGKLRYLIITCKIK